MIEKKKKRVFHEKKILTDVYKYIFVYGRDYSQTQEQRIFFFFDIIYKTQTTTQTTTTTHPIKPTEICFFSLCSCANCLREMSEK